MTRHILCAIDLNHIDTEAPLLRRAAELAGFYGAALSVVSVVPDYGMSIVGAYFKDGTMREAVAEANRQLHDFVRATLPEMQDVQHIIEIGTVYERILDVAKRSDDIDLIVLGAHKPDLTERLQGPNSARIARHAPCSVLIIRD